MIKCEKCGNLNRDEARFCKQCGTKLALMGSKNHDLLLPPAVKYDALDEIVGLDEFKELIREKVRQYKILNSRTVKGRNIPMTFDAVITGDTGVGKNAFVNAMTRYLYERGVIKQQFPTVISSPDPMELSDFFEQARGGVLCIDNVDRDLPRKEENYGDTLIYENLVKKLGTATENMDDRPIVIFTGNGNLKKYISLHSLYNNFTFRFDFPAQSINELAEITKRKLEEDFGLVWTQKAYEKLKNVFAYSKRDSSVPFGNGHAAVKKSREIMQEFVLKVEDTNTVTVLPEHVPGKEFKPKTFDEVIKEFDKFVGVSEIKKSLKEIAALVENERRLRKEEDKTPLLKDHFLFLGNPGTGKTTMARLFADALTSMGVLPVGQLIEVSRKDLVGQWLGSTARLVEEAFNKAEGGVLFIDEAYDLKNSGNDSFGQEAVNTLIKLAEDRRGRVVVILAGYTKEMGLFADANPGIKSRFNISVDFRDYKPEELEEIFRRLVKSNGYSLDESAEKGVPVFFKNMYLKRLKDFGNAREVRNAFDAALKRYSTRIANLKTTGDFDPATERVLTMSDIGGDEGKQKSVEEVLDTLDDLIGMENVKEQIKSIANSIKGARRRMKSGLGKDDLQNIHIVITGNPGTGKTTVAKRLGEIFKALGVLTTDKVVERDRSNLVTALVNSGANNMNAAVDEAMGGILFIDEAYNLYNPQDSTGDKAGIEAVEALMKRMSDDAGKFVTIIAGYKDRINSFINNANPGLKRRFTYWINIEDYSSAQLLEIFVKTAKSRNYILSEGALKKAQEKIERLVDNKDENFGNAGVIMNFFAKTLERQSNRLSPYFDDESIDDEIFFRIEEEDIPMDFKV